MTRNLIVRVGLLLVLGGGTAAAQTRTYTKPTIVDAGNGTLVLNLDEIVLKNGVSLTIVAKTLIVRKRVKIVGVGAVGPKGRNGKHDTWTPGGDRQEDDIRGACPRTGANVAQCLCDGDFVAGAGGDGGRGSRIVLVAQQVTWAPNRPVVIDVTGGVRGPPGDGGIKTCAWNGHQCSSPPCTNGAPRNPGASGSLMLRLGRKAFLDDIVARALPSPADVDAAVAQTKASFEAAAKQARAVATADKYDSLRRF